MIIKSLENTPFDTLFDAFEQAFADYEVQQEREQLRAMLRRRGFCPELSFAAFEGEEIVSFTFNGIGDLEGIPTAYDTGTGTRKEFRGKGLATQIFEYAIPYLKESGIKQYLLEVLQHNPQAISVYSKLGFEVSREFNYFIEDNLSITNKIERDASYKIEPIEIDRFIEEAVSFWDFYPSWQNSFASIARSKETFISFGAFLGEKLVGYSVFDPVSGDITQIAVDKAHRRKGVGSHLLENMLRANRYGSIKVINTDINCTSITAFLESKNIALRGKQFEMTRKVSD